MNGLLIVFAMTANGPVPRHQPVRDASKPLLSSPSKAGMYRAKPDLSAIRPISTELLPQTARSGRR